MASPGGAAGQSKMPLAQTKIKQKQLQEREQRRVKLAMEMAANRAGEPNVPSSKVVQGKVHQMCDERQRGVGIGRSQPLKFIATIPNKPSPTNSKTSQMSGLNRGITTKPISNGGASAAVNGSTTGQQFKLPGNIERTSSVIQPNQRSTNSMTKAFSTLSLADRKAAAAPTKVLAQDHNNKMSCNDTNIIGNTSKPLKPVLLKKSVPAYQTQTRAGRTTADTVSRTTSVIHTLATQRKPPTLASVRMPLAQNSGRQASYPVLIGAAAALPPEDLKRVKCGICHRTFHPDRIRKHEEICEKVNNNRRKIFDTAKHRIKGTEAEKFLKKPPRKQMSRKSFSSAGAISGIKQAANPAVRKSNWRQQHEEFIAAIRAAKQVQAHLARGGKLSDLPAPPPSENPDYIRCPHCLRSFNDAAAERHIPRCAQMQHNKPKPKPTQPRSRK